MKLYIIKNICKLKRKNLLEIYIKKYDEKFSFKEEREIINSKNKIKKIQNLLKNAYLIQNKGKKELDKLNLYDNIFSKYKLNYDNIISENQNINKNWVKIQLEIDNLKTEIKEKNIAIQTINSKLNDN